MVLLPPWASILSNLYWQLRYSRGRSRPSRRTWYRRIQIEKTRLLASGVALIEIHLVTRILANPRNPRYEVNYKRYLERRQQGLSPW